MSQQLDRFVDLLEDIFELTKSDLDFGIYRILNIRKEEIGKFLREDLPKRVMETLSPVASMDKKTIKQKMAELEVQAAQFKVRPEDNEEYITLKNLLALSSDMESLEADVYSHLYNFFSRYYDEGDFISKRRYKEGVYAIPYEGEEVKLYWANQDQYYIKTSENFKDYTFKAGGKTVHFRIVDASTEQNNNKENGNNKRCFMLWKPENKNTDIKTIEVNPEDTEMTIRFVYDIPPEKKKYDEENYDTICETISKKYTTWPFLLKSPQEIKFAGKNQISPLQKHYKAYIAKNTFDYFIHKDLSGFLTRELDFYIKNEIIYLDDIGSADQKRVETWLAKVKSVRQIGKIIIDFLAQIEEFQKKLWLKKKFIVSTDWCVTLDKIPEAFYEEIRKNKAQVEEWIDLYAIDEAMEKCELGFTVKFTNPPKIDFLQEHKNLIIDTKHFGQEFKEKLISTIDNLDEQTNGVLIHSENFQAQRLLQERYKGTINCIYIDPPYNAQSSEILYKNSYKHSSWLSLIYDRLKISRYLLNYPAVNIIAVDEVENFKLGLMISQIFPDYEDSCISIQHNPTGQQGINFSFTHEFAHFIFPKGQSCIGLDDRNEQNRGSEPDVRPLRNVSSGKNHYRNSAANCFYPIFVKGGKIIGFGDVSDDSFHPDGINELLKNDVIAVYPIDPSNNESKWVFARDTVESIADELRAEYDPKKNIWDIIRTKSRFRYKSLWSDKRYSANSWGSVILNNMFKKVPFDYPKSIYTVSDCIDAGLNNKSYGIVLDYFAGSGTTGHAVTNLNREDKGNRKYILVEMGDYFNTVTKPRMQKVIYAAEWKDGKPTSRVTGVSHIMKYFQLESYEDTLTNIKLSDDAQKQHSSLFREEYMVKYMLDIESKGSLINLDQFRTPFTYKLKITEKNETNEKTIDLVETFNYLIGLKVKKLRVRDGFKTVEGTLPDGQKSFVFWRNLSSNEEKDNKILIGFFNELRKEIDFTGIKKIFINGDNSLANMRQNNETFDVCLTETVFKEKMFEV